MQNPYLHGQPRGKTRSNGIFASHTFLPCNIYQDHARLDNDSSTITPASCPTYQRSVIEEWMDRDVSPFEGLFILFQVSVLPLRPARQYRCRRKSSRTESTETSTDSNMVIGVSVRTVVVMIGDDRTCFA